MDSQNQPSAPASPPPSPQVVGNVFVHQYYNILYQSPEYVHKFYQESSKLGRPEPEGAMSSVTTLQAINEKILSMDYGGLRSEIKTVDAQESLNGGVLVLVTGYLTEKDNIKRSFTQSFFLATQDQGFFVLNDIFRYMEEDNQQLANGISSPQLEHEAQLPKDEHVPEQYEPPQEEVNVIEEASNPLEHVETSVVEEETPYDEVVDEAPNSLAESGSPLIQEEAPKKSYASILRIVRENVSHSLALAPTTVRVASSNQEKLAAHVPVQSKPENSAINSNTLQIRNTQQSVADGHSVYIKGLPLNTTDAQLEEEFKRFGPIKPGGVQVRSQKHQGFCFGFIEFETADSLRSAIEASPVMIGGCKVVTEEKRPSGPRVSNSRGRFSGRMGGFRNEGGRGRGRRGNFGGGRTHGRGDFRGGRSGGSRGESVVYQRVDHAGPAGGRGARSQTSPGGPPKNAAPA